MRRKTALTPLTFAEALGVEFSMDWDGEVGIEYPDEIDINVLCATLEKHGAQLAKEFRFRAERRRCIFVGGPFANAQNPWYRPPGTIIPKKVKRAVWAVYRQQKDGRAFFVGLASSEAKARKCNLICEAD